MFASRVFLPAFLFALLISHPELFPFVEANINVPSGSWLATPEVLVGLGVLSFVEFMAERDPYFQELYLEVEGYLKPLAYAVVEFQLADEATLKVLEQVTLAGTMDANLALAVLGAGIVFALARFRKILLQMLIDLDDDGSLGIRKLVSYLESSMLLFWFVFFIVSAVAALMLYGLFFLAIYYWKKSIEAKLERQKAPCTNCGEMLLPYAVHCKSCGTPKQQVADIGIIGQVRNQPALLNGSHQLKLVAVGRCPSCAEKLTSRDYHQNCQACGVFVPNIVPIEHFKRFIHKRMAKALGLAFVAGFIPLLGIVIATIYASLTLLAPQKRYIGKGRNWFNRIVSRILFLVSLGFGVVVGFLAAPFYVFISHGLTNRSFAKKNKLG